MCPLRRIPELFGNPQDSCLFKEGNHCVWFECVTQWIHWKFVVEKMQNISVIQAKLCLRTCTSLWKTCLLYTGNLCNLSYGMSIIGAWGLRLDKQWLCCNVFSNHYFASNTIKHKQYNYHMHNNVCSTIDLANVLVFQRTYSYSISIIHFS